MLLNYLKSKVIFNKKNTIRVRKQKIRKEVRVITSSTQFYLNDLNQINNIIKKLQSKCMRKIKKCFLVCSQINKSGITYNPDLKIATVKNLKVSLNVKKAFNIHWEKQILGSSIYIYIYILENFLGLKESIACEHVRIRNLNKCFRFSPLTPTVNFFTI